MRLRFIFLAICLFVFARLGMVQASNSTDFLDNLKDCNPYYGSQSVELAQIKLTTVKEIHGWEGGKCSYRETVSSGNNSYAVICKFTKDNIAELVRTMEDFESSPENKNIDLNDFQQVQSSSVAKSWGEIIKNPDICSIEVSQ